MRGSERGPWSLIKPSREPLQTGGGLYRTEQAGGRSMQPAASSQQPVASISQTPSQRPVVSSQQPAANSQHPAHSRHPARTGSQQTASQQQSPYLPASPQTARRKYRFIYSSTMVTRAWCTYAPMKPTKQFGLSPLPSPLPPPPLVWLAVSAASSLIICVAQHHT